jgi:hypothetical protein
VRGGVAGALVGIAVPASSLKRLQQLLNREWLGQKRHASRVQRSLANGGVLISGHVNYRGRTVLMGLGNNPAKLSVQTIRAASVVKR